MQEIDDLHKGFLRLVLARYVSKRDSRLLLDVDLGVALSNAHHSSAAHPAVHHIEKSDHERRREYPSQFKILALVLVSSATTWTPLASKRRSARSTSGILTV